VARDSKKTLFVEALLQNLANRGGQVIKLGENRNSGGGLVREAWEPILVGKDLHFLKKKKKKKKQKKAKNRLR